MVVLKIATFNWFPEICWLFHCATEVPVNILCVCDFNAECSLVIQLTMSVVIVRKLMGAPGLCSTWVTFLQLDWTAHSSCFSKETLAVCGRLCAYRSASCGRDENFFIQSLCQSLKPKIWRVLAGTVCWNNVVPRPLPAQLSDGILQEHSSAGGPGATLLPPDCKNPYPVSQTRILVLGIVMKLEYLNSLKLVTLC